MILVRAQKEVKSKVEKVIHLAYIYHHEQNLSRNMNAKNASGDISEENAIHVTGN